MNEFRRDLEWSENGDLQATLDKAYHKYFPTLTSIKRIHGKCPLQIKGVDAIIRLANGKKITVDEKVRKTDYGDFLAERWSVLETKKVGWTFDESKITDLIAYAILPAKTIYFLPADLLRRACKANADKWCTVGREKRAVNRGYTTINYSIEWPELFLAMAKQMKGEI